MPFLRRYRKLLILLGGLVLAGTALGQRRRRSGPPFEPSRTAPPQVRTATVDGIGMRWEQYGDELAGSTPIVFVHGLPTSPRAWRYVIPMVAQPGVCCFAWEQVGFGGSLREGFGRDLSIPAQAGYLSAWLRHLDISKAVFVGHDYGGGVIQHLMVASPGLFSGFVLTDSVAFENWPVAAVRVAKVLGPALGQLPSAVARAFFRGALKNLGHTNTSVAAECFELFWRPYREIGPRALANQLQYFDNRDTSRIGQHLRPLPCPGLVIWGEHDPLGLASARRLADRLDVELRIVPGAYHFTVEDHPGAVADAVQRVVRNSRST